MRRYLPRPHQVVLLIGFLAAVGALGFRASRRRSPAGTTTRRSPARSSSTSRPRSRSRSTSRSPPGVFLVSWLVSLRVRNYERGKPDNRRTNKGNVHRRMRDFRAGVWMRTLLRDPAAGVMHSLIYFGFLVLFIVTVLLEIDHQLPESLKFLHGRTYQAYAFVGDLFGLVFLAGIAVGVRPPLRAAAVPDPHQDQARAPRDPRDVPRRSRSPASPPRRSASRRCARSSAPAPTSRSGRSSAGRSRASSTAGRSAGSTTRTAGRGSSTSSRSSAFLVILPTTMLRHMITSPMNMYLKDRPRPKGAMREMPNLMETELETFGASTVEDFTWKQLFDTDACTICGRCTSVCPAHATGKPLDPRDRAEDRRGDDRDRLAGDVAAGRHRRRDHRHRRQPVRAHHVRGAVGLHHVQGVRRDLPGEHRDPRQDPRHAPVPLAHGERLPGVARQRVPVDGELRERLRHEPGRAGRLGRRHRRRRDRRPRRRPRPRVPLLGRLRGLVRRPQQEDEPRGGEAAAAGEHRLRDPRPERALHRRLRPGARATSTSSRCSRCRTSRRSTGSA